MGLITQAGSETMPPLPQRLTWVSSVEPLFCTCLWCHLRRDSKHRPHVVSSLRPTSDKASQAPLRLGEKGTLGDTVRGPSPEARTQCHEGTPRWLRGPSSSAPCGPGSCASCFQSIVKREDSPP